MEVNEEYLEKRLKEKKDYLETCKNEMVATLGQISLLTKLLEDLKQNKK